MSRVYNDYYFEKQDILDTLKNFDYECKAFKRMGK